MSAIDALEVAADSTIPKSEILRVRMLTKEIEASKHRIRDIISRLTNARDKEDVGDILKQLATEGLLTVEQFQQLNAMRDQNLNAETIAIALTDGSGRDV